MEDSQRQSMFDAWARSKKWTEVKVKEIHGDAAQIHKWVASCTIGEQNFDHFEFGDTKSQVIQRMDSWLSIRGYRISNRYELFNPEPEKKTFLEWLRHVENGRKKKQEYEDKVRRNHVPYYTLPPAYIFN